MEELFCAVNENYQMSNEYKYAWQAFQISPDEHTWTKFTLLIDWMEKTFTKGDFFNVMGKSYDLEDKIFCRIRKTDEHDSFRQNETWLMSNLFRYVENPAKDKNPIKKYVGTIKFTKMIIGKYEGSENVIWTPTKRNDGTQNIVDDIKIEIFGQDGSLRRYEMEYGWRDKWSIKKFEWKIQNEQKSQFVYQINEEIYEQALKESRESNEPRPEKLIEYEKYVEFTKKWAELKQKMKVPVWYQFNPENPNEPLKGHNMLKKWDTQMFEYLKEKKWVETKNETDGDAEKSQFEIDCNKLLGIGGEGIVIQKATAEKNGASKDENKNGDFEALKIVPIKSAKETLKMSFDDINHFKHNSIVEYLNVYLDFIKVFEEKYFVVVIGRNHFTHYLHHDIFSYARL